MDKLAKQPVAADNGGVISRKSWESTQAERRKRLGCVFFEREGEISSGKQFRGR